MQRQFILQFLLFSQFLNAQGMPNLEVRVSKCLKSNKDVRLRKPKFFIYPSPMCQHKFNFLFLWDRKQQKTHLLTLDSSEHNPLQKTVAIVEKFQEILSYQILCGLLQKERFCRIKIVNQVYGSKRHVSFHAVSSCVCEKHPPHHYRFSQTKLNDPRDISSILHF